MEYHDIAARSDNDIELQIAMMLVDEAFQKCRSAMTLQV